MIEKTIQALEQQLLDPDFRGTQDVALLFADDFVEFGSSGCVYNKQQIVESLLTEQKVNRSMTDFKIIELSPHIVFATYKATNQLNSQVSLRSSIWKLIDDQVSLL